MDRKNAARRIALSLLASTLLIGAAGAQEQTSPNETAEPIEAHVPTEVRVPTRSTFNVGAIARTASVVNARDIGRVVAPGVIQIDPAAIGNRRIVLKPGDLGFTICIGVWHDDWCIGILVETLKVQSRR